MKLRTLNVQAPSSLTRRLIAQSLPRFLHTHPRLRVVVREVNPADAMLAHYADAAICIGPITNPDLVAHNIGTVQSITCASPDFIECTGIPESPANLDPNHCIVVHEVDTHCAREWVFRRASESYAILPTGLLAFSDGDAAIAAAMRGGGYARVLCIDAEQQIAAGLLIPVLNDWNDDSQPVSIVHARCRRANKEVLAFRAFMGSILPPDMTRRSSARFTGSHRPEPQHLRRSFSKSPSRGTPMFDHLLRGLDRSVRRMMVTGRPTLFYSFSCCLRSSREYRPVHDASIGTSARAFRSLMNTIVQSGSTPDLLQSGTC